MLRKQFYNELNQLDHQLVELSQIVVEQLRFSLDSLKHRNKELALAIIEKDKVINQREAVLVESALTLIALQQPVSSDLRKIISVLKASADLERIGDHAASVAKAALSLNSSLDLAVEERLIRMGEEVLESLVECIEHYYESDSVKVIDIASKDQTVDDIFEQVEKEAMTFIKGTAQQLEVGHIYLQIAMHLERIGDYSKNICEWIVYRQTGEHIHL